LTVNDVSLTITNISPHATQPTVVTSPNHNMSTDFVIKISGIPDGTPFDHLNGQVFGIILGDNSGLDYPNKFRLMKYNATTQQFSDPQLDPTGGDPFIGYGLISIRENFSI